MNKEDILMRSRKEKDEGMEYAENKGRKIGVTAFCIVFIFIVLFNFFTGQQNYAVFAMFWAFAAAEAFPKYRFTGQYVYLVSTVCGAIASAASLLSFIIASLR